MKKTVRIDAWRFPLIAISKLKEISLRTIFIDMVLPVIIDIFWRGWVIAKLWLWFMVPLGLASITLWHAYGLSILLFSFVGSSRSSEEYWSKLFSGNMLGPALLLVLGFVAKLSL